LYYKVHLIADSRIQSPVACDGTPLESGFGEVRHEKALSTLVDGSHIPTEDVPYCVGQELVVSKRVKPVLGSCSLPDGVSQIPLDIVDRAGSVLKTGCYEYVHFPEIVNLLDESKSVFRYGRVEETAHIPMGVLEAVIDPILAGSLDLFYQEYVFFVCSERFRRLAQAAGISGLGFEPLPE